MSDLPDEPDQPEDVEPVAGPAAVCTECQSSAVRPSHSSYPLDKERISGGNAGFWRCHNCGTRFLGPPLPERKQRSKSRRGSRHSEDVLTRSVKVGRMVKRWAFPVIVILSTIIAVIYILDRRNTRQEEQIIFPG